MTELRNILSNSDLAPDRSRPVEERQEQGDSPPGNLPGGAWHHIWSAVGWNKTTVIKTMPGSLGYDLVDRDNVPSVQPYAIDDVDDLGIEVNDRRALITFSKSDVLLSAGHRYLAKLTLTQDVVFARPNEVGEGATRQIFYRASYDTNGDETYTEKWQQANFGQRDEVILYRILQANADVSINFHLQIWIPYGNLEGKVYLHKIELLEAPLEYGGDDPVLEFGDPDMPDPDPIPLPYPEKQAIPWGTLAVIAAVTIAALVLFAVLRGANTATVQSMSADLNSILAQIVAVLQAAVTTVPGTALAVTALVTIAKRVLPLEVLGQPLFSGNNLNIAFHTVLWGVWVIAQYTGHGNVFEAILANGTPILTAIAGLIGGIATSRAIYGLSAGDFWYKRT